MYACRKAVIFKKTHVCMHALHAHHPKRVELLLVNGRMSASIRA